MRTFRYDGVDFKFSTPNKLCEWRIDTILKKEPHMPKWIKTFRAGEVFFDIGANIGQYSILAAKTREVEVFSFEPDHSNYFLLNRNIHLNKAQNLVKAYCMGLGDKQGYGEIGLGELDFGYSGNDIRRKAMFQQGCFIDRLDNVCKYLDFPDHVKIDVDGVEDLIIEGGIDMITRIMSMSIELDLKNEKHIDIIRIMQSVGFFYDEKQVWLSGVLREGSRFEHYRDYVFYKG